MPIDWKTFKVTVEWLYGLLKRRSHNRIALIVVVAGVSILASPFWEPYLRILLERSFAIRIDPPPPPLFGFGLIGFGLLYHYGAMCIELREREEEKKFRQERRKQIVEHDKRVAAGFRTTFPEATKQKLGSDLLNEHAYWDTQHQALIDAVTLLNSVEAHFLDTTLQQNAKEFVTAARELLSFMGLKFFVYPREQIKRPLYFAMQPNLNLDREGSGSDDEFRRYDLLI